MRTENGFRIEQWNKLTLPTSANANTPVPMCPLIAITALTKVGNLATASTAPNPHNLFTGQSGNIYGANDANWNGNFVFTVIDAQTFTYQLAGIPAAAYGQANLATLKVRKALVLSDSGNAGVVTIGPDNTADARPIAVGQEYQIPELTTHLDNAAKFDLGQWWCQSPSANQTLRILWVSIAMMLMVWCFSANAQYSPGPSTGGTTVSGPPLGGLVPAGAKYSFNSTFNDDIYILNVAPGVPLYTIVTNTPNGNFVYDPYGNGPSQYPLNGVYYNGTQVITPVSNVLWIGDGNSLEDLTGSNVQEQLYDSNHWYSVTPLPYSPYPIFNVNGWQYPTTPYVAQPYTSTPLIFDGWGNAGTDQATEIGSASAGPSVGFIGNVMAITNSPMFNIIDYRTLFVDAGWQGYCDTNGFFHENAMEWPDGMSNCFAYAHSLGLKIGFWTGLNFTAAYGNSLQQSYVVAYTYNGSNYYVGNTSASLINPPAGLSNDQVITNLAKWLAGMQVDFIGVQLGTNSAATGPIVLHELQTFRNACDVLGYRPYIQATCGSAENGGGIFYPFTTNSAIGLVDSVRSGEYDGVGATTNTIFYIVVTNFFKWGVLNAPATGSGGNYHSSCDASMGLRLDNDNFSRTIIMMGAMCGGWGGGIPTPVHPATAGMMSKNYRDVVNDPLGLCCTNLYSSGGLSMWWKSGYGSPNTGWLMILNTNASSSTSVTITNLTEFGYPTSTSAATCLDLASNITRFLSNDWGTVTVPPQTAYGYKLTPHN